MLARRELENPVRHLTCVHPGTVIEASQLPLVVDLEVEAPAGSVKYIGNRVIGHGTRVADDSPLPRLLPDHGITP
jgi:hypothetical protein